MPTRTTVKKAKQELRRGKSPTTAAGAFVHEEIEHVRQGKHGARSTKQAIAIGLSKARRAGVPLKPPAPGRTSSGTRRSAERDYETGQGRRSPRAPSPRRSRANLAGCNGTAGARRRAARCPRRRSGRAGARSRFK